MDLNNYTLACADDDIKDIEFTVTTLNCHAQSHSDDTSTPEHQRSGGSRLSIKKTGALGKAVKSKLTKTLYNSMDGVKPKTSLKLLETHVSEDLQDDRSPTSPSQAPTGSVGSTGQMSTSSSISSQCTTASADKGKKRSKLCALL